MPYKVVKRGDEHCVVRADTGATVKCHPSRAAANRHLAALYIHVEDAKDDQNVALRTELLRGKGLLASLDSRKR